MENYCTSFANVSGCSSKTVLPGLELTRGNDTRTQLSTSSAKFWIILEVHMLMSSSLDHNFKQDRDSGHCQNSMIIH